MYALGVYTLATLVAALSPSWEFLFWSRVVAGAGIGAESAIIAPFLSEFVQSKFRGRFIGSLAGFFSFGFVFAALLGSLSPIPQSRGTFRAASGSFCRIPLSAPGAPSHSS